MSPKIVLFIMARFFIPISAAVLAALALANIAHHFLGMPPSIIRSDSLIAATFLGAVLVGTCVYRKSYPH
jgi:hypothetical protein